MAELDFRADGVANIAYFGLTPEATGKRLGYFFLYQKACASAWAQPIWCWSAPAPGRSALAFVSAPGLYLTRAKNVSWSA